MRIIKIPIIISCWFLNCQTDSNFDNFKQIMDVIFLDQKRLNHLFVPKIQISVSDHYTLFSSITELQLSYFFTYYLCLVLFLPLIYCFLFLLLFLKNYIGIYDFGKIPAFEVRLINFTILTRAYWWALWENAYILVTRYEPTSTIKTSFSTEIFKKFPNPRVSLSFFWDIFIIRHWPSYLAFLLYLIIFFFALIKEDVATSSLVFFSYFLANYIANRWKRSRWSLGLLYHRWIIFKLWKNINKWWDFFELMHLRFRFTIYPLFLSFFLFLLVSILLLLLYFNFFFLSATTWNGYFINTIVNLNLSPSFIENKLIFIPLDYTIALDGLNIWLIWLTSLLVLLCTIYLLDTVKLHSFLSHLGWIYLLAFASFQFFCVSNYFWMYIYFELSLLPIFILIVFWGSNWWKVHAAYQMVLFTFVGSLFLLAGIFLLFTKVKSFSCFDIFYVTQSENSTLIFSFFEKKLIWFLLFIGFAVKTPLYPFHIWLPEAHSEAPTTGSVMLAGVLLKMGTYGFLRYVIPLFPIVLETFKTLVFSMCLCGIILSSLAALAQVDIKKIIAYSSIGHMGLVIIGIYTMTMNGLLGASYMMLSHGLVSSALFFSIGLLYKIYGTRSLVYFSSLAHFMPRFSMCFFLFSLANMSFPGTAGFPGELLIFTSIVADNFFFSIFVGIGSIFGGIYSIWLLTWILYGQISPKIATYWDLKSSEWKILNFLFLLILFFGIFPVFILDFLKPMCMFFTTFNY